MIKTKDSQGFVYLIEPINPSRTLENNAFLGCITEADTYNEIIWMEHEHTDCNAIVLNWYVVSRRYRVTKIGEL